MTAKDILSLFLEKVPSEYPEHQLCYFADNGNRGVILPFLRGLVVVLSEIDLASPGYATEMLERITAITGTGDSQYESIIQILSEIYVTGGAVAASDRDKGEPIFTREPGAKGLKNPEFETSLSGNWCAVEVKAPKLFEHRKQMGKNDLQVVARMPSSVISDDKPLTLPRDNPVKDFLISSERKFAVYETHRQEALGILVIVWDDFCNEPITALVSPISGLLTPNSFHRTAKDQPIMYPHIDGIIVARYQHQIFRATRCEPLIDGARVPLRYHHDGFPPKAFIEVPGGRKVPDEVMNGLNAIPLSECMGAEYHAGEIVMWVDV